MPAQAAAIAARRPADDAVPRRARRLARRAGGRRRMSDVAILATPKGWPSILLPGAAAGRRQGRRERRRPDRPRRRRRGPARSRALRTRRPRPRRRPAPIADDRGVRPARPRRRRLPGRRQVARRRAGRRPRAAYVVANGYEADPASADRPRPHGARPVRRHRGRSRSPPSRSARDEAIIAVRAGGDGRDPGPRGGHRRRRGRRLPRARTSWAPAAHLDVDRPARPGRLHARRGDGPAQGPRGQARPARAAPAVPARARPLRPADRRPQRRRPSPPCPGSSSTAPRPSRAIGAAGRARHDPRPGPRRRPAPGSPRSRSGRRSARSSPSPAAVGAGRTLKAVLVGGPSGGILPPELLDTPYTFEALRAAGAHVGSGSVDRGRRAGLHRGPRPAPHPLLRRRGLRQDDPLPDRHCAASPRSASASRRARPGPATSTLLADLAADIVGSRPVRPRAPGDPPAHERDAILPGRARRPHPRAAPAPPASASPIALAAGATH